MRLLAIEEVLPGDVLARSLWTKDRRIVLREESVLTERSLEYLKQQGYRWVPIRFPGYEGIEPVNLLGDALFDQLRLCLESLRKRQDPKSIQHCGQLAGAMVDKVREAGPQPLQLMLPRERESFAQTVALNRALLVLTMGYAALAPVRLVNFVWAALLLDAGPGGDLLTGVVHDYDPMHGHRSIQGTLDLLGTVPGLPATLLASIRGCYAHWDGSGMPGDAGDSIFVGGQLMAPANRLARLIVDTEEHPAWLPHEALEWIMGGAGTDYALPWVAELGSRVAPYGIGTTVKLSTGEKAVVQSVAIGVPGRPTVRVLSGPHSGELWRLQDRALQRIAIVGPHLTRDLES